MPVFYGIISVVKFTLNLIELPIDITRSCMTYEPREAI